jgi:hypothetical protein
MNDCLALSEGVAQGILIESIGNPSVNGEGDTG